MIQFIRKLSIKTFQTTVFLLYYLKLLVISNLWVAYAIIMTPRHIKPGIIAIPLDIKSDLEIIILANLITMTPGTISMDVSTDRSVLYVHAMYIEDVEGLKREIKDGLERKVKELFE